MHASFCCIYSLSCLSLSQSSYLGESLSITFMTASMRSCWWLIHGFFFFYQTFHEHRRFTQQWRSPGSEISISELQFPPLPWQLPAAFQTILLIHFLPWSSKTVLLSFNCSVKVVVRIKENMREGFKIVLTKINSNHVGSNYSSCRSRGNPWHVFNLYCYYKSVF